MRDLRPAEKMILEITNLNKFDAYFCKKHGLFMSRKNIENPNKCPHCVIDATPLENAEQLQKDIKDGK